MLDALNAQLLAYGGRAAAGRKSLFYRKGVAYVDYGYRVTLSRS